MASSNRSALMVSVACAVGACACRERGCLGAASGPPGRPPSYGEQRLEMVRDQLAARGILDGRVLDAMGRIPRERFVPEPLRGLAYADRPLPIGRGQTISQPYVVALSAEALALRGNERVLEVGSGSGYAAAVLSLLASGVYGIELEEELYDRSAVAIRELGYPNVRLRRGDGFLGWPEEAPFDAILLSCAARAIPGPLWEQLADGGRLLYPKGKEDGVQELVLVTKAREGPREERIAPVRFVPMRRPRRTARRRRGGEGARAAGGDEWTTRWAG